MFSDLKSVTIPTSYNLQDAKKKKSIEQKGPKSGVTKYWHSINSVLFVNHFV